MSETFPNLRTFQEKTLARLKPILKEPGLMIKVKNVVGGGPQDEWMCAELGAEAQCIDGHSLRFHGCSAVSPWSDQAPFTSAGTSETLANNSCSTGQPYHMTYNWTCRFDPTTGKIVQVRAYLDTALLTKVLRDNEDSNCRVYQTATGI